MHSVALQPTVPHLLLCFTSRQVTRTAEEVDNLSVSGLNFNRMGHCPMGVLPGLSSYEVQHEQRLNEVANRLRIIGDQLDQVLMDQHLRLLGGRSLQRIARRIWDSVRLSFQVVTVLYLAQHNPQHIFSSPSRTTDLPCRRGRET